MTVMADQSLTVLVAGFQGGNNDQVCVVHCHRCPRPLSFIGRSRQEETARSGGQVGSDANLGRRAN
jgi:hypothetical protein